MKPRTTANGESLPSSAAHRHFYPAFTLTELLVVIAIIAVLIALLFSLIGRLRENATEAKNISRMKEVATALLTGAVDNNGFIPSRPSTRGRWPTAAHREFGIRTDLAASDWGQAAQINQSSYTAEVMRPVQLDYMRKAMLDGSTAISPQGIWLVNNRLVWRGTVETAAGKPMPLHSVTDTSKTPLISMPSDNNGLSNPGKAIHPSALKQGFKGSTDISGPAPLRKGNMIYVMCDGSAQTIPDFWPFRDPRWPEPWRAFHPLGKDAPASDAP
jgi:prepilin-type N-terminal cleavage/methylation domain-containing protein